MVSTNQLQVQFVLKFVNITILLPIDKNVLKNVVIQKLITTLLINTQIKFVHKITNVQKYFIQMLLISLLYKYNVQVSVQQKLHILMLLIDNVLLTVMLDHTVIIMFVIQHVHHTVQTNT